MFAKNSKAYSVYLLFRFVCSLAVSMSTVLSIVYHLEVVQLDAFQLVLVGTVQETSCFLFEMPTGVVADLYSRRRSVLIGMFLYGLGFLMEGALPWFAPVLLAQVVWGCGDTFITGALEAWIASEEEDKPIDKVFLRGSQMGQIGGVLGVVLGTLLGNINLQMPVILGGSLCLLLGLVMVRIMPETNFSPAIEERQGLLKDFVCLFKLNLGFVKGAPVLLALLAITLCGGLASEGFDRLSTAHFLDDHGNTRYRAAEQRHLVRCYQSYRQRLRYSGFSVAHRPHGEKRDCQPNQCGHVHQRRVYPVPGSLRGGAELLVHVVGVPAGGAYAHHQGACAGRLDERPSG